MSAALLFKLVAAGLFALGLYGLTAEPHVLRKLLAVNLMSVGVFLFLVSSAADGPGAADPVPHAMVITGIVVSVSATALALALTQRIHRHAGDLRLHWRHAAADDDDDDDAPCSRD